MKVEINRVVLWEIWVCLTRVSFNYRDVHWKNAIAEVKKLLLETQSSD